MRGTKQKKWEGWAALVAVVVGFALPSSATAQPGVAWQVHQTSTPTVLVPGTEGNRQNPPRLELFVTNVGGVSSSGTTVTDEIPSGLEFASVPPRFSYARRSTTLIEEGECAESGHTVTCAIGAAVAAGTSVTVIIPLKVGSGAPPEFENQVTVQGGGTTASSTLRGRIGDSPAPFALLDGPGLAAGLFDEAGETPLAGAHPFAATFSVGITTSGIGGPTQSMRSVAMELPFGMVANPDATPRDTRCNVLELVRRGSTSPSKTCSPGSQVGEVFFTNSNPFSHGTVALYNVVPPYGAPAALGFEVSDSAVVLTGGLSGGFRLTAESREILAKYEISEVNVTLWGIPSDPRHDGSREGGEESLTGEPEGSPERCMRNSPNGCPVGTSRAPFLTAPTSCTGSLDVSATVTSWLGDIASATRALSDRNFRPTSIRGCGELTFSPTIESRATTPSGESPSGLDFSLHQPQDESLGGRATAALKDASVALPEDLALNPSAANGLGSCTEEQMGYAPVGGKVQFKATPQACPDAAKVGTLEVHTPLLESPQGGSIFVAKPFDNPFGSLLAIYLAVEDEETGIIAKLAGKVTPDAATGQLIATFTDNPELPIEDFELHFFSGNRGVLTTPIACGTKTTNATLTPWSTPEGPDAHLSDSFETSKNCASSEASAPKTFDLTAGTVSPLAGAYSPFVLRISRPDGSQHITGIETALPQGLLGKLAGVSYCPESGITQAISREVPEKGKLEQQSPSCPSSSEVGTVNVTAGSGSNPIPISGHAYLAGPYKGAPLSLVAIVPAVAGPFDLGTVVDRVALNVGEYDASIHAVADPLPTIREGIPVDVRSIELKLNRPGFTLNPTSCEAMQIEGLVATQAGQSQPISNRFQVGECGRLGFKPKLEISLKGATGKSGHPALKATVTYPRKGEYANIARAQVNLPHSEFLDQGSIGKACTKVLIAQRACPARSIYGKAKAWTPLLDKPLEGPVYLVGGYGYKLPALVAELNGQIRVLLVGKVDSGKNHGIRNTFEAVPDAPVEKFVLEMKGGKKYGLLENSENLCRSAQKAGAVFRSQSGRVKNFSVKIANSCKRKHKSHQNATARNGK